MKACRAGVLISFTALFARLALEQHTCVDLLVSVSTSAAVADICGQEEGWVSTRWLALEKMVLGNGCRLQTTAGVEQLRCSGRA